METGNVSVPKKFQSNSSYNNKNSHGDCTLQSSNKDQFNEGQQASTLEENDRRAKKKMMTYADAKAYVRPSEIKEGDTVFVRRDDTKRKRDTPYRPGPYVVIAKKDQW